LAEFSDNVFAALTALSQIEMLAVLLAVLYLLLAIRQNIWCWSAAFISTSLYFSLMYGARLYMEAILQLFYAGMAVYGWYQWRYGSATGGHLAVSTWRQGQHMTVLLGVTLASVISGWLLTRYTNAALPYMDSFTTWGAVVSTWMVARKVLENWIYWFVIDSVSIYIYIERELYLTAMLFGVYLVLIIFGYVSWQKELNKEQVA